MTQELDKKLVQSFVKNENEIAELQDKISNAVATFETELRERQKKQTEIKDAIKEAMRNSSVKKFENDIISITYVMPTTRKSLDTKRLKEEKPELWEEYSQTSDVKDSIRIKVNNN